MKQLFSIVITLSLLFALSSCANTPSPEPDTSEILTSETSQVTDGLTFSATNLQNEIVTEQDFKNAKLILMNFWEPWCGPCVGEMPDLQKLYEKYREQGLEIIGVFSTMQMETEATELIKEKGITYTILRNEDVNLQALDDGVYPTSYFLDGEGHILSPEPVLGALSGEEWESMILEYLQ